MRFPRDPPCLVGGIVEANGLYRLSGIAEFTQLIEM
jgi:hypothetical protein